MRIDPATDGMQSLATSSSRFEMRFWEYKDRNMHRGIIDFEPSMPVSQMQIDSDVRKQAVEAYSPSWARGFAFGTVLQFERVPGFPLQALAECVDGVNKSKGVWQWVIAVDHERRVAYAAHMWLHGSLHSIFDQTLNNLSSLGYHVSREYLPKPSLFKGIDSYLNFAPKAIHFLKKIQLGILVIFVIYLIYVYFD